jgi:hypothetical protein
MLFQKSSVWWRLRFEEGSEEREVDQKRERVSVFALSFLRFVALNSYHLSALFRSSLLLQLSQLTWREKQ